METVDSVIAVFADHDAANSAVTKLTKSDFATENLSVLGKESLEHDISGFYRVGDRIKFWGLRGAFWGGLWGVFSGGIFIAVPVAGHLIVLGYLATVAIAAIESAAVAGGVGALGAGMLYYLGLPEDTILHYEATLDTGHFLVMAHGGKMEMERAKTILLTARPIQLDVHEYTPKISRALADEPHKRLAG
jgi:hypothetical protein